MHFQIQSPRDNPHVAVQAEKIVKLFVDAGAHLDAVNANGLTPARVGNAGKKRRSMKNMSNLN